MAQRRGLLQALFSRHGKPFFSTNPFPNSPLQQPHQPQLQNLHTQILTHPPQNFVQTHQIFIPTSHFPHHFSSKGRNDDSGDEDGELADELEDDDDEEEESDDEGEVDENEIGSGLSEREYSIEEKEKEACEIGYKVIGPLEKSDRVFKPYEPVFAVVQIGSHQFKVSNGDCIFTERLKFCEVNDKLLLNKVLLLGSSSQTIIGRPILPDAAVYAIVEEHALDAKVIIFKKKRRKNYRRTKGHRQELTKLRIVDIQGVEKPEPAPLKPEKPATKKPEKIANKKQEKVAVVA